MSKRVSKNTNVQGGVNLETQGQAIPKTDIDTRKNSINIPINKYVIWGLICILFILVIIFGVAAIKDPARLNNVMTIIGIVVSLFSLGLSIMFYFMADESSKQTLQATHEIQKAVQRMDDFTKDMYHETFDLLKENVRSLTGLNEHNVKNYGNNNIISMDIHITNAIFSSCLQKGKINEAELYTQFPHHVKEVNTIIARLVSDGKISKNKDCFELCSGTNSTDLGSSNIVINSSGSNILMGTNDSK